MADPIMRKVEKRTAHHSNDLGAVLELECGHRRVVFVSAKSKKVPAKVACGQWKDAVEAARN